MQNFESWFAQAPLWLLGLITFSLMILCALLGYGARRLKHARDASAGKEDEDGQEGYLVSAMMGLFALLLGFTFAMAVDRYDFRRRAVLEEANAIGTTYLRTQILGAPHRERISRLLVAYTDNRIALGSAPFPPPPGLLAANDRLLTNLWQATLAAFPTIRDYDFSSSFLDSMNTVIDLDASRKAARQAHVPTTVFVVLVIYAAGTATVLGGVLISGRSRIPAVSVMALFVLALMLTIDIDRPTLGTIRESQGPIERLRASILAQSPEVFDMVPG
jgi:hypothetical protein